MTWWWLFPIGVIVGAGLIFGLGWWIIRRANKGKLGGGWW